jgi:ABC-type antimicrobial peptide transport system permease subunit
MRDVLMLMVIGLAIGVPGAIALERLASDVFYGLADVDGVSIGAAISILVAGVAAYLPARRASLVDPMTALRYE